MRRIATLTAAAAVSVSVAIASPPSAADTVSCDGSWSIAVGGFQMSTLTGTWQDSSYLYADTGVAYNTLNPMQGMNELDRLHREHRAACPADHIKILGHSEGAAITHAWVSANKYMDHTSAVLLADPKQAPGPGSGGLSGHPLGPVVGYPLAGTDADFGSVPVLSVCNRDDVICNRAGGWLGYVATGAHQAYNMYADAYPDNAHGVWFR